VSPAKSFSRRRKSKKRIFGKWSGRKDLNLRPPGPEPGALARLRYAPTKRLEKMVRLKRDFQINTPEHRRLGSDDVRKEEIKK
jgi:hypothetical protein